MRIEEKTEIFGNIFILSLLSNIVINFYIPVMCVLSKGIYWNTCRHVPFLSCYYERCGSLIVFRKTTFKHILGFLRTIYFTGIRVLLLSQGM
jgi:hypothetical protein